MTTITTAKPVDSDSRKAHDRFASAQARLTKAAATHAASEVELHAAQQEWHVARLCLAPYDSPKRR